jgi:hypothetical protein
VVPAIERPPAPQGAGATGKKRLLLWRAHPLAPSCAILTLLATSTGACTRFGFEPYGSSSNGNNRRDASLSDASLSDGGRDDDGGESDGPRRSETAPLPNDGGVLPSDDGLIPTIDAAPRRDMDTSPLQPRCAPPGPPAEARPAVSPNETHLRASSTLSPFCLDAPPSVSVGDSRCQTDLGTDYRWSSGGGDGEALYRAAQEVLELAQGETVTLVAQPESIGAAAWSVAVANCERSELESCTNIAAIYTPDCLPVTGTVGRLWCSKTIQGETLVASDIEPGSVSEANRGYAYHGAYDSLNKRYGIIYTSLRAEPELRFVTLDDYGKALANDRAIATQRGIAHPRLIHFLTPGGKSRYFALWQTEAGAAQGARRLRLAVLDGSGSLLRPIIDPLGFDCYDSALQHALSFDTRRGQVLLLASGNADGAVSPILTYGRLYDIDGRPISDRFALSNRTAQGLAGRRTIEVAYDRTTDRYLLINGVDAFAIAADASSASRHVLQTPERLHGLAANQDAGGFLALMTVEGRAAAVPLDLNGRVLRDPLEWSAAALASPSTNREPGGGLEVFYLPQSTPGTFAGSYLVRHRYRFRVLNADGSACFPATSRTLVPKPSISLLVPNTDTGGFALLYSALGPADSQSLYARLHLSNADPY